MQLTLIYNWSQLNIWIESVSDLQFASSLDEHINELFVAILVHNHSTGCCAALASSSKTAPQSAFNRQFKVCIFHDANGILAAQFARYLFHQLATAAGNSLANIGGTSDRNHANTWIFNQSHSHFATRSGDKVEYAWWQPSFNHHFNKH